MRQWARLLLSRWGRLRGGGAKPGREGEARAAAFLKRQRYRILARNLRTRYGEVDLLAEAPDGRTIVVVEVKSGGGGPIPPEMRVNHTKQRRLTALAAQLVRRHRLQHRPIRFDVIGIDLPEHGQPRIRHHVDAFRSHV